MTDYTDAQHITYRLLAVHGPIYPCAIDRSWDNTDAFNLIEG